MGFDQTVNNVILGKKDTIIDMIMDVIGGLTTGYMSLRMLRK